MCVQALSWWPQEAGQFVTNLRKNLTTQPRGANLQYVFFFFVRFVPVHAHTHIHSMYNTLAECADPTRKMTLIFYFFVFCFFCGFQRVYNTLEECAGRRAKMNIVGALDPAGGVQNDFFYFYFLFLFFLWVSKGVQHAGGMCRPAYVCMYVCIRTY